MSVGEPETVIRVENLGKKYEIHHTAQREKYATLRDTLACSLKSMGQKLLGRRSVLRSTTEEFWALRNVSFEVKRGEVVGIIGRNGSGKSTLLKILSRITEPTTGRIEIDGRVASLLEVGSGFHPELTGRENIYLNGSILGMARSEIKRKFDEIVAFAAVEKFLDTPVKRYSSGMYMRLAFAVAAHLEPEILVVDEVLAVGDAEFQKKCLGKMGSVAKGGRTVLFVSHNMQALASLCNRAALLQAGSLIQYDLKDQVLSSYLSNGGPSVESWSGVDGDHELALLSAEVSGSEESDLLRTDRPVMVRVRFHVGRPILGLICAVEIYNRHGTKLVYSAFDDSLPPPATETPPGTYALEVTIPADMFAAGLYRIEIDLGIHNIRRVTTGAASLSVQIENIAGCGRRYLAHIDLVRPMWKWRPLTSAVPADTNHPVAIGSTP